MSEDMQDPTGEYQRHQSELRFSRTGTFLKGMIYLILGILGFLLFLYALGLLLWKHESYWLSYVLVVATLASCVFIIYSGWQSVRQGRLSVMPQEVQQAKRRHRRNLQEAAQGKLPDAYSKRTRYFFLGMMLLFGLLDSMYWFLYLATRATDWLTYAIGFLLIVIYAFLCFLNSFGGKTHQQSSAEELRRILQAGEFEGSEPQNKGE